MLRRWGEGGGARGRRIALVLFIAVIVSINTIIIATGLVLGRHRGRSILSSVSRPTTPNNPPILMSSGTEAELSLPNSPTSI